MRIETIETLRRLREIALDWDELYKADTHAHFYLSSQFILPIATRTQGQFRILAAWSEDGRCVGLLPLLITLRWSKKSRCLYNVIDMLGHVFDADYTGILCWPDMDSQVCAAFGNEVAQMPFGRTILNYFNGPKDRLNAFAKAFPSDDFAQQENAHLINDGQTNNLVCPYIDLPKSYASYLDCLSANTRQKIKRLTRQLSSDPQLKITRSQPETYTQDVSTLGQLWYQKHVTAKGEKRAKHLADLFKEAVMLGLATGTVYLAILWRSDKAIAAQANYIDLVRREALFHVSGRDMSVTDFSAGLALQAHCIRWAIANGLKRYDFTIGDEPYKFSLGATPKTISSLELRTHTNTNLMGRLDHNSRADVLKIARQFTIKGRAEEAAIAAQQAIETWPDLKHREDLRSLASNLDP